MFNRMLFSKDNDSVSAAKKQYDANLTYKGFICHRTNTRCNELCSMLIPAERIDRKTPEDRHYIYTSYCAEVENVCLNIKKQST